MEMSYLPEKWRLQYVGSITDETRKKIRSQPGCPKDLGYFHHHDGDHDLQLPDHLLPGCGQLDIASRGLDDAMALSEEEHHQEKKRGSISREKHFSEHWQG